MRKILLKCGNHLFRNPTMKKVKAVNQYADLYVCPVCGNAVTYCGGKGSTKKKGGKKNARSKR